MSPTAASIVSSSTPNTMSPSSARTAASSSASAASASASVARLRGEAHLDALDARRQERDRDRRAGGLVVVEACRAACSASMLSDWPHVRSTRLRIVAVSPERASRSGSTARVDHVRASRRARRAPRRSPCGRRDRSGRARCPSSGRSPWRPSGTSAWRKLFAAISRPRARNISSMRAAIASSRTSGDGHHFGDGFAGDVVLRRTEPAAHDHRVGARQRGSAARARCARGCRRPPSRNGGPCPPPRAFRRATPSSCRRSGRAATRCRPRLLQLARALVGLPRGSTARR